MESGEREENLSSVSDGGSDGGAEGAPGEEDGVDAAELAGDEATGHVDGGGLEVGEEEEKGRVERGWS